MENKIRRDAIEMVKNIPSTDETTLEKFESTEWTDVLTHFEWTIDEPAYEYDVIVESSLYKFVEAVNSKIWDWWVTVWGVSVVQTNAWTKFYQSVEKWMVNEKDGLSIPWLENEPDLYEDMIEDVNDR